MKVEISDLADRILEGIKVKSFPDDYIEEPDLPEFDLPPGRDVMMYRELEGVFVLFDVERIFFKDPYEAKYVYYCARKGLTHIRMPGVKSLKKILRDFQSDLENLRAIIEKDAERRGLDAEERNRVIQECARKLGYLDIMDI